MCGRYTITTPTKALAKHFGLIMPNERFMPTDDARPTNNLPIVLDNEPNQMVMGHWGYPIKIAGKEKELINVRLESIIEKPYWHQIAEKHRCIILADGFYEWKREGKKNQKYRFTIKRGPMAIAGIYEWHSKVLSKEIRPFFSIITAPAKGVIADIHDRMPFILPEAHDHTWLTADFAPEVLAPTAERLIARRV